MAVSKRLRYEVLRRDGHKCRYCGATALDGPLTVDHVVPTALGGSDEPGNLVAACRECNSGKSATTAESTVVADVEGRALLWAAAITRAAEERRVERERRGGIDERFLAIWHSWSSTDFRGNVKHVPVPNGWASSVHRFLDAGLTFDDLHELVDVAMNSKSRDVWKYFCGCCWRRLEHAQARAHELIEEGA